MPVLQAEEDRDQVRRYYADKAREKELLGEETKLYNSDRYVHVLNTGSTHDALVAVADTICTASSALLSATFPPMLPNKHT